MKPFLLLALSFTLLVAGCSARIEKMTAAERSERLAAERGRLADLTDPAARAESFIVVSDMLLSFAWEVVRDDELGDLPVLLSQYHAAIESAWDALIDSRQERVRRTHLRKFDAALSKHLKRFEEMKSLMFVEDQGPVEDSIGLVNALRKEVLLRLVDAS